MMYIFAPVITLVGLGIFFGLTLAFAAKKFHVQVDPMIEKILSKLPGANCGACGKAGCMGFAQALLAGELDLHSCASAAAENKKDMAAGKKNKLPADIFTRLIDPIIKEIQYSFDLFLHQTGNEGKRPEKIILTGGTAVFPPIAEAIKQAFPMKVFVGDPWARVVYQQGLKTVLDKLGPRMSVAIGLALRGMV